MVRKGVELGVPTGPHAGETVAPVDAPVPVAGAVNVVELVTIIEYEPL